ncbi:MAG: hypothetical protein MUQ10_07090, partial [Anaerolineae bacterium]|nr:hypothetical protein [Anaerolineae bacterium]
RDMFLNGQRLVLKGVNRHEFTAASGYSPVEEDVRHELAMIRHAGFNYVRLVHSPQAACVCRIAAELGLLVSEEPGACFHDLSDERIVTPALECLARMVRRDRNVPSVLAWLIYNECNPDTAYAVRAAEIIRALDPGRLIAMADCSGRNDDIKAMVQAADLSFYGINLYSFWPKDYTAKVNIFNDRPIVITEWGGWIGQGNPRVRKALCDNFAHHTRAGKMTGCAFWAWADYEEYSRDEPAAIEGWTVEGLVDKRGRPKEDLLALSKMCYEMDHHVPTQVPRTEILSPEPVRSDRWQTVRLNEIAGDQSPVEEVVENLRSRYAERPPVFGRIVAGGIEFLCRDNAGLAHPLLLGPGREELFIPVGHVVSTVAVLGHIALLGGYPSSATWSVHHRDAEPVIAFSEVASEYELVFDDGAERISLRHGLEILRGNNICRWWKTAPRAPFTRPAVQTTIHPSYEILRLDLWERTLDHPRYLTGIRWQLVDRDSIQAMYALSIEVAD